MSTTAHASRSPRSLGAIFLWSLLGSTVAFFAYFYVTNRILHHPLRVYSVSDRTYVTEQIDLSSFRQIRRYGIQTLIDIRPDGEDPAQTPSEQIRQEAENRGLKFAYIPVAHGPIPEQAVTTLQNTLLNTPKPVLLYCRSGNRAARTFALVLASQSGGPDIDTILNIVKSTGHSADDLRPEIQTRISKRPPQK